MAIYSVIWNQTKDTYTRADILWEPPKISVNVNGSFRNTSEMYVKVAGQWRFVNEVYTKQGGVWRKS